VVISVVTAGRKVHRVLVDQGSSTDVMFWMTFNKLQLSPDLLRTYTGFLYGFAGDQVEVRGNLELRTTFTDGVPSRTEKIRYLVVNAPSGYNLLLGRPMLKRLRAVASTRHMKMKLPNLGGKVITIKSDQKEAKRRLKARDRRPELAGEVLEREIGGRTFKLGKSLGQAAQYQIAEVIARHLDAFAWCTSDMPGINPDFLCHRLTMDPKVRPVR